MSANHSAERKINNRELDYLLMDLCNDIDDTQDTNDKEILLESLNAHLLKNCSACNAIWVEPPGAEPKLRVFCHVCHEHFLARQNRNYWNVGSYLRHLPSQCYVKVCLFLHIVL